MTHKFTLDHFKAAQISEQEESNAKGGMGLEHFNDNFINNNPVFLKRKTKLIIEDLVDVRMPLVSSICNEK